MNKVVKHHIPVERLPEELRHGFAAGEIVEVEVRGPASDEAGSAAEAREGEEITLEEWLRWVDEQEPRRPPLPAEEVATRNAAFERIRKLAGHRDTTIDEAVRRIRELRDEDDD